jgi:hypothetical protein
MRLMAGLALAAPGLLLAGAASFVGRLDTIGGTTYDWQANGPALASIVYDPGYGIHVAWTYSADPGPNFADRRVRYNFRDASGWRFSAGPGFMNYGTNVLGARSGFGMLDVNPVTHVAYLSANRGDTARATMVRDATPGQGSYSECIGPANVVWPVFGLTSTQRVFVALTLNEGINNRIKLYGALVDPWGTWSTPAALYGTAPFPNFPSYTVAASKLSRRVAAVWTVTGVGQERAHYRLSGDDGATWGAATQLTYPAAYHPGGETIPSFAPEGLHAFYDSRDSLHIMASVTPVVLHLPDSIGWVAPAELWHWARASGWSLVSRANCDTLSLPGHIGTNTALSTRPSLSEGVANELVCVWEEFNPGAAEPATGQLRADIWGARSTDGGVNWSGKTRLTDPDNYSRRFPCISPRLKADTCLVAYVIDRTAGSAVHGEGGATNNPVVVQYVPKSTFRVPGPDVGVERVTTPSGTYDVGTSITPACSAYNYGTTSATYSVRMRVGSVYDNSATVTAHAPGAWQYVTFPVWFPAARGTYAVVCSSGLSGDIDPANDTAMNSCTIVGGRDVGVARITSPAGGYTIGTPIIPACTVANYGTVGVSYSVRLRIGGVYDNSVPVTAHAPGTRQYLTFPLWTPAVTGTYAPVCSTGLGGDVDPANDTAMSECAILEGPDIGVARVFSPADTIALGATATPACSVVNFGTVTASGTVHMRIGSSYDNTAAVSGLVPGAGLRVTFPDWTPALSGYYAVEGFTTLSGDVNRANDTSRGGCYVRAAVATGWSVLPDVPRGPRNKAVKQGACLASLEGSDAGYIYALKGNSTCEFYRFDIQSGNWQAKESIPAFGRSGKKKTVSKGANLTSAAGRIYAAKGNGTVEWWQYDPALSGSQTYPWSQKADIPLGVKSVKEGSGSAMVRVGETTYVYSLKGSGTAEFYRYNTLSDAWQTMANAPGGASGKNFKNGSCIAASDDGAMVYALKGSYNEFFAYDAAANTWAVRSGMPLTGSSGKKKKVKDGAGLAYHDSVNYALKGGGTFEFWSYTVGTDAWRQLEDVPMGGGKPVKAGGAIVLAETGPALYVLKGNKTTEFYKYGLPAYGQQPMASGPANTQSLTPVGSLQPAVRLRFRPSVLVGGSSSAIRIDFTLATATAYTLKLYDVTGKLVRTLRDEHGVAGAHVVGVGPVNAEDGLPGGIYLLELACGAGRCTQKLVIETKEGVRR